MIPPLLKLRVPRSQKKPLTPVLPYFLGVAPTAFNFFGVLPPWCSWFRPWRGNRGYGRPLLMTAPMILSTCWHLHGLTVDVETDDTTLCIAFI